MRDNMPPTTGVDACEGEKRWDAMIHNNVQSGQLIQKIYDGKVKIPLNVYFWPARSTHYRQDLFNYVHLINNFSFTEWAIFMMTLTKNHCPLEKTLQNTLCFFTCTIVSSSGIFYRGPRHPGNRYSVDDHPVIIRQGSHVWIGPAAGIEIWLRREGCCNGL